jgi:LysR family transcriptional regulator, regulator for bpeEF and oprC
MDRLDAMRVFVRVVETGSFSAVARELGIGQPAVSKQIAALEGHVGAQLLRRTSRSLSVTQAGSEFYAAAVRLVEDLDAAIAHAGKRDTEPAGL